VSGPAQFYNSPETAAAGVTGMENRLAERGLAVTRNASGTVMQVHPATTDA
jgi:hypothetical protein